MFLKFCPECTRTRVFSRHIFPAHFVGFLFSFFWRFLLFSLLFHTVCARAQASIFTVLCPFSQRNCQIVEEVWTMREQVVKSKDLTQDKPRSRWPGFFYKLCEKCYRKSCKYMRNNSTRLQGKKKTSTSQYQSFEHNGMEICDQQRLESLEEKKGGAHFMQAWHQKNLQTLYQRTTGRQTHVMRTL